MIVLGIDPGIAITGCAIVNEENNKQNLIFSTAILTSASVTFPNRLLKVYEGIIEIINKYKPDTAVLENLFFNTNAKTALLVGQSRGVIQLALEQQKIPIFEYTPLEVKMSLSGYGRADKSQIQLMVKQIFKLEKILSPDDVADAAAVALTHCFYYKMKSKLNAKMQI